MRVSFLQQVKIDGHVYSKGMHDLEDSVALHWFFKALLKDGSVKIVEEEKPVEAATEAAPAEIKEEKALPIEESVKDQKKKKRK